MMIHLNQNPSPFYELYNFTFTTAQKTKLKNFIQICKCVNNVTTEIHKLFKILKSTEV